jgi:hypothetical protein
MRPLELYWDYCSFESMLRIWISNFRRHHQLKRQLHTSLRQHQGQSIPVRINMATQTLMRLNLLPRRWLLLRPKTGVRTATIPKASMP